MREAGAPEAGGDHEKMTALRKEQKQQRQDELTESGLVDLGSGKGEDLPF